MLIPLLFTEVISQFTFHNDNYLFPGVKAKMCILPGQTFIETHLKSDGAFEMETINAIVKAMSVYKDATFLGNIICLLFPHKQIKLSTQIVVQTLA